MTAIRIDRPLPLLVEAEGCIYDLRTEFDDTLRQWRTSAYRFEDGFAGWVTHGRSTLVELREALAHGIEIAYDQPTAALIAWELVNEGRASFVELTAA